MNFTGARRKISAIPLALFPLTLTLTQCTRETPRARAMYTIFPGQSVPWQSSNRRPDADFGQKRVLDEEAPGKLYGPPKKLSLIRIVEKRLISVSGCMTRHIWATWTKTTPRHWNSQLLVVPDVFHFDLHVDFASSNHALFCGGVIVESE